jgi:hypothetical protein
VPAAAAMPKPPAVEDKAGLPSDDFNAFDNLPDFDELLEKKQNASPAEAPLRLSPEDEPAKQSEFADMAGRIPAATTSVIGPKNSSKGLSIDNTLLALLASVILVVLGGMVWGLVAKFAHMELGLLACAIGALAGAGIMMLTTSRGVLLGLAAALIAFFGILCGKYFIAKWYYMPEFMAELKKEESPGLIDPNKFELNNENIQRIMSSREQMFGLAAMQLAEEGQITREDANSVSTMRFARAFGRAERGDVELNDKAQAQRIDEVEAKVYKCLAEWDNQKKEEVVRTQYPKVMKEFADALKESPIINAVGFVFAYISAFSLFDLLWFPLAMVTAYKFGTGESG